MPDNKVQKKDNAYSWAASVQRDVVMALLTDRSFFVESTSLVDPHYFPNEAHGKAIQIARDFFDNCDGRHIITKEVLLEELRIQYENNPAYEIWKQELEEMFDSYDDATAERVERQREWMANQIFRFAKIQAMRVAIVESVDALRDGDYGKIEESIKKALLLEPDVDLGLDYFGDINERFARKLARDEDNDFYPTGFQHIDEALEGGIFRKEFGMFVSPPGVGKSLALVKAGVANVQRGKNVLHVTLEMSEDRVAERYDSVFTVIPQRELVPKFNKFYDRISDMHDVCGDKLRIKEFPPNVCNVHKLRAFVHKLTAHTGWRPDLVIIDYLELMSSIKRRDKTYEEQQEIAREFRGWLVEENFAGFTATQTNRMGRQVKTITDNELGDSYGKIREADAAWSINQTIDVEKPAFVGRMYVMKHRNGAAGYQFPIMFDYPTLRMTEIDQGDYDRRIGKKVPEMDDEVNA